MIGGEHGQARVSVVFDGAPLCSCGQSPAELRVRDNEVDHFLCASCALGAAEAWQFLRNALAGREESSRG